MLQIHRALRGLAVVALAATGACSLVLDPAEVQCDADSDCSARGFAGATCETHVCVSSAEVDPSGPWRCLGSSETPPPIGSDKVTFSYAFISATSATPVADVTAHLCGTLDVTCASPIGEPLVATAAGTLDVTVDPEFDGFLLVESPTTVTTLAYLGTRVTNPPRLRRVQLIRPVEYDALGAQANVALDPTRGTAILVTVDCDDSRAANVTVKATGTDDLSTTFYFKGVLPDRSALATDIQGAAGIVNIPRGIIIAEASRLKNGAKTATMSFQVQPNRISYVFMGPAPKGGGS